MRKQIEDVLIEHIIEQIKALKLKSQPTKKDIDIIIAYYYSDDVISWVQKYDFDNLIYTTDYRREVETNV